MPKTITASAIISELQSSDMYLSVRGRLCDTKTNANGVAVTEAFIDEIVANQQKYVGIPLCADVRGLINDRTIGHMYNKLTGQFMSAIIGSMCSFEKETAEDGTPSLIIGARVMKRYSSVCKALAKLFAENRLKFSFELSCGEYTELDDGTLLIDASDANFLEGAAVVTFPACEDAVAMELVAECLSKGDENMAENEKIVEVAEETEPIVETASLEENTEEIVAEETENSVENTQLAEESQVNTEESEQTEDAQINAEEETAEVYVTHVTEQRETVRTYDDSTGVETSQTVVVENYAHGPANDSPAPAMAETDCDPEDDDKDKEQIDAESEHVPETDQTDVIAELKNSIQMLASELATLKETLSHHEEVAEQQAEPATVTAEAEKTWSLINPFVADIGAPRKYSLLDKDEHTTSYTLL